MNDAYSTKTCPYCTGLHGELLRLSEKPEGYDVADKGIDATDPIVAYAKSFCQARGRGIEIETKELAKLTDAIGPLKASSVNKLCWASVWGQTTGNSINSARDKILSLSLSSVTNLDIVLLSWYGPLFVAIGIVNAILKRIPGSFPAVVSTAIGVILWIPQAVFIAPVGFLSLIRHFGCVV